MRKGFVRGKADSKVSGSMSNTNKSISLLFDEGTFVETGAYITVGNDDSKASGATCGYGAINGALVFAFAQDFSVEKGALGRAQAEKICALYDMALKNGAPVIGVFASAGVRVKEGSAALAAYGKLLAKINAASGVIPQIAVVDEVCSGLSATAAAMFDLVIANKDSKFYITPPSVAKANGVSEAGSAAYAFENGNIDIICDTKEEALAKARDIVSVLPQNSAQGYAYAEADDDSARAVAELENAKDIREAAAIIADNGRYTELKADFAPNALTAIASLGQITVGICGLGGALGAAEAKKISSFISFCDNFSMPVITVVDSCGADHESLDEILPGEFAKLASAYAGANCPKITYVLGKAYGASFTLVGSKALGADIVYAAPKAEISVLSPEASVQFMFADEIKAADDSAAKRAELLNKWKSEEASPEKAAANGSIDDVVAYAETRARIISAVEMLFAKISGNPAKKHSKLPF